jgi:uncharacterized protein YuzE
MNIEAERSLISKSTETIVNMTKFNHKMFIDINFNDVIMDIELVGAITIDE